MIERYTLPRMGALWTEEARLKRMLDVEVAACEAMARLGQIPRRALAQIKRKARVDARRIKAIERETQHDVVAFITNLAERIGPSGRFLHKGLTSSDVLDTATSLQLRDAADLLLEDLDQLLAVLKRQAHRHRRTVMIGRTHGVHAEPITFGLKLAVFYDEFRRQRRRVAQAREAVRVGKISGAVGTYANVDPFVERYVCRKLGLVPAAISTQIVQRDSHAEFLTTVALVGASLEKLATEIRHLQRTEVLEAEEPFSEGQTGSSAMPHKRNPVVCERISGLARLLRSYAMAAMENVTLWHERDISHSSVERVIFPDATILLDYMVQQMTSVMRQLIVYPDRMQVNLEQTHGLIHSQRVLLALIEKGMTRKEAYTVVQRSAMQTWRTGRSLRELLSREPAVRRRLTARELTACFDLRYHLKHVERILKRLGI